MGISLRGTCDWGETRILGTLKDGWRRAPLLGNSLSKAWKWASISIWTPLLGNMDGRFFIGAFFKGILIRSFRDMHMPCRWVSLSIGAPLGNLEGVLFLGLLREKKQYFWASFLDPEVIKILSLGATAPMIGVGEETSAHILCECEALASLRHAYLGSFLEPEDIRSLGLGAIWSYSKAAGLPYFDMGHKGPVNKA